MSSLTVIEKRYLEQLLNMGSGYVLDFSDRTFGDLFNRQGIDIHGPKYQTYGTSKAKKMRAFWEQESDATVSKVLNEMMDQIQADHELKGSDIDLSLLAKGRDIVTRLTKPNVKQAQPPTEDVFLEKELAIPNLEKLPVEGQVIPVIDRRLKEARLALEVGANLSVVFLCGSVLEAVLLGAAQNSPSKFSQADTAPKPKGGTVKKISNWSLAECIDVACEVGLLKPDVVKFSHGLRDFRNYIHPQRELLSDFTPDQHTAKVCMQVLIAALADVAGER